MEEERKRNKFWNLEKFKKIFPQKFIRLFPFFRVFVSLFLSLSLWGCNNNNAWKLYVCWIKSFSSSFYYIISHQGNLTAGYGPFYFEKRTIGLNSNRKIQDLINKISRVLGVILVCYCIWFHGAWTTEWKQTQTSIKYT